MNHFDIIVIGGGHAGIEAAQIASQFDLNIALITMPEAFLGSAPCNPSIGGVGKGQVVRELDALGGIMGILADKAGIQFRTLNESKGFAVQSSRVQIDKDLYSQEAEKLISAIPNITIIREKVLLVTKEDNFHVTTNSGEYQGTKLVVTVGTFLNGKLHTGSDITMGGRIDCDPSAGLQDLFQGIKTQPQRFKTGTPPRLNKSTIDYSKLEEQPSDSKVRNFHCLNQPFERQASQVSCYLAKTNETTMEIIRENKEKSPMFNGQIKATGARYCPSIEDKAYRYPDKNVHHVFIEPEGLNLPTMYPSGISSSLPRDVQLEYVRSMDGLENAEILVYGYAVEYDVVDTTQLTMTLESIEVPGLYFAGQVNGTSGYEEAAGQGLVAGANAALKLKSGKPLILNRHDSYIGVMIEDLASNLRDEPYRLFTARSENRLYLREDNTIERIRPYRSTFGLFKEIDHHLSTYLEQLEIVKQIATDYMIEEESEILHKYSGTTENQRLTRRMSVAELLRQGWINPVEALEDVFSLFEMKVSKDVTRSAAISIKYDGYISRAEIHNEKIRKLDSMSIEWASICSSSNVSFECKQRIERIKPQTFGQLKLIEGIRPATLAVVAARTL